MNSASGASAADRSEPVDRENGTGNGASAPFHFAFSTHDVPPEDKFEIWRDLWMRQLGVEADILSDPPHFHAKVDLWQAGPLSLARVNSWNTIYRRTDTLARNGSDDFSLTLCQRKMIVGDDSERLGVQPGAGFFLPLDRRFTVQPSAGCYSRLLRIDRKAMLELMPRDFEPCMQQVEAGNTLLKLVSDMLSLITSKTEPSTKEKREAVGGQIVDLVALLLCPSRDGRALIEARGLKAARQGSVLQAIDQQFADPALSAESIGQRLGISDRHVHRLLLETTKTFYEHLLERRLQRAHELLSEPATSGLKIADVAKQAGFAGVTYFNHAFKRRFGDTPKGVRTGAATEQTLRVLRHTLGR